MKPKLFLHIIVLASVMLDDASSTFIQEKGFQVIQVTDQKMGWECEISLLLLTMKTDLLLCNVDNTLLLKLKGM